MPSVRWNEYSAHLTYSVSELYRNSELTDCFLDVEGQSIEVHKVVLAACSPYFKKILKNRYSIARIPIKDVTYENMKLILDFIYFGEADVRKSAVSSLIKTAELLEMISLKHSVFVGFGEEFSCNDTSARSMKDRCVVSCSNQIRADSKNLLEEQVQYDSSVLCMREVRLNCKSQNIQIQSIDDFTKKYFNDFEEESGKLNGEQPSSNVSNTSFFSKNIEELDEKNINNELDPVTFVAVTEIKETMAHEDNGMSLDLAEKDPLGEYSSMLNFMKEREIKKECTFQNELQVKKEPKDERDVPESMTDDVLTADNLTHSFQELISIKCDIDVSCDQKSVMDTNPDVTFNDAFCHEGSTSEEADDLRIKFESICQVSRTNVKEEKIFETGHWLNHSVAGDDTATSSLEPESELLKSVAQHSTSNDLEKNMNEEEYDADTSKITSKLGKKSPAIHTSGFTQVENSEERKELMQRTGNNSSPIPVFIKKKLKYNQPSVSSDISHVKPIRMAEKGLTGKHQTNLSKTRKFSCIICRKSFIQKCHLAKHMRTHSGEEDCKICKHSFASSDHLKILIRKHSEDKRLHCKICNKSFSSRAYPFSQIINDTGQTSFICKICKKTFPRKSKLENHLQTHTGEHLFDCKVFKQLFTESGNLTKHMPIHVGEKQYECAICKKAFTASNNLKTHMRKHTGEKRFECDICKKSFNERGTLKRHMRTHTGEKPFECDICKKSFTERGILNSHILTHAGKRAFQCDICKKSFTRRGNLNRHMRTHTGEIRFECDICKKSFTERGHLNRHMQKHTGEKPFGCDICQKSFFELGNLNKHMRTHTGEKRFQCDICKMSFAHSGSLYCHMRRHTGKKAYQCDICEKLFTERGTLIIHLRTHTGEKPFICDICEKSFAQRGSLNKHKRTHSGEKPFVCNFCEKLFTERGTLITHMRTHTGEKPFACNICKKSFTQRGHRNSHMQTHTGEKAFECEICGKSFTGRSNLKKHMRIHTGEKPFVCDICKKTFRQRRSLKNHMRIHTGEKPFECEICKKSFIQRGILNSHKRTHTGEKAFENDV